MRQSGCLGAVHGVGRRRRDAVGVEGAGQRARAEARPPSCSVQEATCTYLFGFFSGMLWQSLLTRLGVSKSKNFAISAEETGPAGRVVGAPEFERPVAAPPTTFLLDSCPSIPVPRLTHLRTVEWYRSYSSVTSKYQLGSGHASLSTGLVVLVARPQDRWSNLGLLPGSPAPFFFKPRYVLPSTPSWTVADVRLVSTCPAPKAGQVSNQSIQPHLNDRPSKPVLPVKAAKTSPHGPVRRGASRSGF